MKRYLNLTIISLLTLIAFTGCNKTASVSETKESQVVEDVTVLETEYIKEVKYPEYKIDIDLTTMSPTMVKSVVSSLNMSYERYVGQIVKANGECSVYHDEKNDKYYYTCIFIDSTKCCEVGLEFEPDETYIFPDDYPKDKDFVTVVGIFDYYKEGATTYKVLKDAQFSL
ncbi:MAG: hypothetical protein II411_04470 [Lachnospiraceae bacterium]|nr:hypothetical protein [Lachnospiraceae bacterium]